MADETTPPNLDGLVAQLIEGLSDPAKLQRLQRVMQNAGTFAQVAGHGGIVGAVADSMKDAGALVTKVDDASRGAMAVVLAHVVAHLLGVEVPPDALRGSFAGGENSVVGKALAETVLSGLSGPETELVPGNQGAVRLIGMLSMLTLTPWFEGIIVEWAAAFGGVLHPIEEISKLGHELIDGLGLSRLARVALRPIAQTTIATPLGWQLNKAYRPTMLGAAEAIRQFTRGRWSREQLFEELARAGYSDNRIEALIAAATKTLSLDDALVLLRTGTWSQNDVIDLLKQQGYEEATARVLLTATLEKRLLGLRDDSLSAIRTSYVNREINESEFSNFLGAVILDDAERAAYEVAAQTSRELNVTLLSHGEIKDAVKAGIQGFGDYRAWLAQKGYSADDSLTLELLLRAEKDAKSTIEQHRAQAEAERAAAKAAKDAAAAERRAQVEADRAAQRRGSLSELNRAAVRGLIPFSRYEEVLRADYDADTVQIYVDLVEADRQIYLDQQARADEAKQRAARRTIDVGAMEQAVLAGVVSIDEYRSRLTSLNFDARDIDILAGTLAAQLADRQRAQQARADADLRASKKAIDLGRFEQLVRRGVRTLQQYAGLLADLGFDDAARAGMVELLQLKIGDDAAAAAARAGAEPQLKAKGLSLEQFRRAVLLGVKTPDDFQAFLIDQQFTADAQALIMAELRDDLAQAEAAQSRRAQADALAGSRALPLATIRRAVQLGVITPDVYQLRLIEAGYSSDDVSIEMDVLLHEIADVQDARARRATLNAQADEKGIALSQVERAVRAGVASIDDYRARAQSLGYSTTDVLTLTTTLQAELAVKADAQARHSTIDGQLHTRNLSLSELDTAVKKGLMTLDAYAARLLELGYEESDAELLISLLVQQLDTTSSTP